MGGRSGEYVLLALGGIDAPALSDTVAHRKHTGLVSVLFDYQPECHSDYPFKEGYSHPDASFTMQHNLVATTHTYRSQSPHKQSDSSQGSLMQFQHEIKIIQASSL